MKKLNHLGETFNTVVSLYDQWRPTYCEDLYHEIFKHVTLNTESHILEIGIGTGQATKPFLDLGCQVTAVELGKDLAEFTLKKYSNYTNLKIQLGLFQDFKEHDKTYDLIYSATAFHWIPEEIGYTKVFNLLKDDGVFARFANRPYKDKSNEPLHQAIQGVYRKYTSGGDLGPEFDLDQSKSLAMIAMKYGFKKVSYYTYQRIRTFTPTGYIALLQTYSDVINMDEDQRQGFLEAIETAIMDHGGKINIYDTMDLQLAFK
ncbi:MAG: class I SAM-dependent methyltransferase [Clostridia bacterium]|nr:class I SAM-dependent methyltransferase [Clostridia bacterium]